MTVPKYRLIYFNLRVLGEPIRFMFNYLGVPFEDVRIDRDKEWAAVKETTGWGKLPMLEIDGKQQISQSSAIAKYIARQHGSSINMDGADVLESAKIDEIVGTAHDFRLEWRNLWFEPNQEKKEQLKRAFLEVTAPRYLSKYNKIVTENGGKYIVGSGLTWADLFVTVFFELFEDTLDKNILQPYPTLQTYKANIYSIPQIKKCIENRPPYKV